jgi:hypothetical protein
MVQKEKAMRIFIAVSTAMFLIIGSLSMATPHKRKMEANSLIDQSLFVLKASRKFKGAEVEVFSSSGYLVMSKKLTKRKLIIDFKNVRKGNYRIKVNKGDNHEEFQFNKN